LLNESVEQKFTERALNLPNLNYVEQSKEVVSQDQMNTSF